MTSSTPSRADLHAAASHWLSLDFDPSTQTKLRSLLEDANSERSQSALRQAFSERLSFGTAGLRGLMGVGPGNMNRLVIRQTTAGLADCLKNSFTSSSSSLSMLRVVIAYDGRHGSYDFAHDAAGVLAARGICALLYRTVHPTPLGAFAVKHLQTDAGIVVTASHNPPEYNGYKVYWKGGNQINDPIDGKIAKAIISVAESNEASPECMDLEEAEAKGLLKWLGEEEFDAYKQQLLDSVSLKEGVGKDKLVVAYTPLHGVGARFAEDLLKSAGITQVHTVKEQREPDGDFPTVNFPNPEEKGAMDLVIALADRVGATIAVANDPDADRLSACARDADGVMRQLTGDQVGALLGQRMLSLAAANKTADKKEVWALSTVVSSRLLAKLAKQHGAHHRETLTGFKWLGAVAKDLSERGEKFVFAYEEALGYMVSPMVWDKDGLTAIVALCELAAELHQDGGKTLWDQLEAIHRGPAGASVTMPRTIRLPPGARGSDVMRKLRADLPKKVEEHQVILVSDLLSNPISPPIDAPETLPRNDVLRLYFADGRYGKESKSEEILASAPRIIVRPSGTEPKVKIYCEKMDQIGEQEGYAEAMQRIERELGKLVDAFYSFVTEL